jgi:hypothetical protein
MMALHTTYPLQVYSEDIHTNYGRMTAAACTKSWSVDRRYIALQLAAS